MGCISSKTDINDLHSNIFQVMNVDELGNRLNPGQLEITETDLVLHQRRKAPVKWPLRCLRRYGFDAELFSFESGRRCPTGPGIYAFRCQRAEQLFNLLQTHIQVRNNAGEDAVSREFTVPSAPGPAVPSRGSASGESIYLDPVPVRSSSRNNVPGSLWFVSQNGGGPTRLSSVGSSSNGPLSPQGTASPSPPPVPVANPSVYYANEELFLPVAATSEVSENNNKKFAVTTDVGDKPLSRLSVGSGEGISLSSPSEAAPTRLTPSYINVDITNGPLSPTYSMETDPNYALLELSAEQQQEHLYMNITPGPENGMVSACDALPLSITSVPSFAVQQEWEVEESKHCYANLEPGEIEVPRSLISKRPFQQIAMTPPPNPIRQVNYIVLDLDQSKSDSSGVNGASQQQPTSPTGAGPPLTLALPPESPHRVSEGYATIDFNKTVALSHSVNPSVDNDSEGSRKTRHNSTINDLIAPPTRHSSSE